MKFNNTFFFSPKFLNLNKNLDYIKCLTKCENSGKNLFKELEEGSNEILNSFKSDYQKRIKLLKKKIIYDPRKIHVIIGMGGSSSGAKAISSYLGKNIIFFDNLDFNYFYNFLEKEDIFNFNYFVISKSGDTFETLALLNLLVKTILKKKKKYLIKKIIYIISDKKRSFLTNFANKYKLTFIEHNKLIGGRFSIFSETALLTLNLTSEKIYKSSEFFLKILKHKSHNLSPTTGASLVYYFWKKKKFSTYVNLIYDYRLKHFSYWFHQLHAESLGKKSSGLLPFTSICPKDHHSMMQLFIDGPRDKIFNIFKPTKKKYESFTNLGFSNIEKYTPSSLIQKQCDAVINCFKENKIPHRVIEFKEDYSDKNIFDILSYFTLETIILGYAAGINPYNQPSVQKIKDKIFKY